MVGTAKVTLVVSLTQAQLIQQALETHRKHLQELVKGAHRDDMKSLRAQQLTVQDLIEQLRS